MRRLRALLPFLDIFAVLGLLAWFLFLYSNNLETILNVAFLFVIAYFVEKTFIPRPSMVANLLVIGFIIYSKWDILPELFRYYFLGAGALTLIALFSYFKRLSLPDLVYDIAYVSVGLKTVLPIYLSFLLVPEAFSLKFFAVLGISLITIWYVGVVRFQNKNPLKS